MSCSILQPQTPNWKFNVPKELAQAKIRPDERIINKFIRDCVSCLQGYHGSQTLSTSDCILAAKTIVNKVEVLKDPRPPSFPSEREFPYWVNKYWDNISFLINY